MNKTCAILFHQGYTDIINCIAIVKYYKNKYENLILFCKNEMKNFVDFFTKDINNITLIYEIQTNLVNNMEMLYGHILNDPTIDILFFGVHDNLRKDKYVNIFASPNIVSNNFVERFYVAYDIEYSARIEYFYFERHFELENEFYNKYINIDNNDKYILVHENKDSNVLVDKNKINKICNEKPLQIIDLDKITDIFFDSIKLLEGATEIHCIDSSWAAFIFLVDSKYKLFKNKKINIYVHCLRGYNFMFQTNLDNWICL